MSWLNVPSSYSGLNSEKKETELNLKNKEVELKNLKHKVVENSAEGWPWSTFYQLDGEFLTKFGSDFLDKINKTDNVVLPEDNVKEIFDISKKKGATISKIALNTGISQDNSYQADLPNGNKIYFVRFGDELFMFETRSLEKWKYEFKQLLLDKNQDNTTQLHFLSENPNSDVESTDKDSDFIQLPEGIKEKMNLLDYSKPTLEQAEKIIRTATWGTFVTLWWKLFPIGDILMKHNTWFILNVEDKSYVNCGGNLFFDINNSFGVDIYYYDEQTNWLLKYKEIMDIKVMEKQENVNVQIWAYKDIWNINMNDIVHDTSKPILYSNVWWKDVSCIDIWENNQIWQDGIKYHAVFETTDKVDLKMVLKNIHLVVDWEKTKVIWTWSDDHYLVNGKYNKQTSSKKWQKSTVYTKVPASSWFVAKTPEFLQNKTTLKSKIFYIDPKHPNTIPTIDDKFISGLKNQYLQCDKLYTIKLTARNISEIKKISWLQVFSMIWKNWEKEYYVWLTNDKAYMENVKNNLSQYVSEWFYEWEMQEK